MHKSAQRTIERTNTRHNTPRLASCKDNVPLVTLEIRNHKTLAVQCSRAAPRIIVNILDDIADFPFTAADDPAFFFAVGRGQFFKIVPDQIRKAPHDFRFFKV